MTTLLLDADGVFVDFVSAYLGVIKHVTGKTFTADQITDFDICKILGLTPEEKIEVNNQIGPGFCRHLAPLPEAVDWIKRLTLSADIYVVTSPFSSVSTWTHEREAWIKEHIGLPHSKILHGSAKHLVRGDFFVDDRAENCVTWDLHNPGTAVMWKSPWNEKHPWAGHRFNEWEKLEALIQGRVWESAL